jgi:type IV secretory pathway VirB10-like protein
MIVRLGALGCAAFALGILASPAAAQQAAPDQLAQATPQAEEPTPPPFPPMPRAKPSHRWTSSPPHSAAPEHRTTHSEHRTTRSHHAKSGHSKSHSKSHAKPHLTRTEKDLRYCHQLNHRHQMRNARCKALLADEKRAAERRKERDAAHKSRVCHRLTKHELKHNKRCQALLRDEKRAAEHRKSHREHRHHHR